MEERLDELDDPSYRLMMDIQTGRMLHTPRPARRWMLVGLVTVILGGLAGLLLASGNRMRETTHSPQAPVSTFTGGPPQLLSRGPQDLTDGFRWSSPSQEDTPHAYKPQDEFGSAGIQPPSSRNARPRTKNLSTFPEGTGAPKPASAPPNRLSKPNRKSDRLGKDRPQGVVQQRPPQLVRSPASDFDPNADLVRSAP